MTTGAIPELNIYRFIVSPRQPNDPRSAGLLADAHHLGLKDLYGLECHDLYFIQGILDEEDLRRIACELLSDPITQTAQWGRLNITQALPQPDPPSGSAHLVEVALRPGVTDPVAEQILRASHLLGISGVKRASTGQRYWASGKQVDEAVLHTLARRLLANPVIQRYALGEIEPVFPLEARASGSVDLLQVRGLGPDQLLGVSNVRRAALDLEEMQAIQAYYEAEGREPTDVEFETIAQTWSEHCVHKTFKALITIQGGDGNYPPQVDGLLKTYLRAATERIAAPWVRSAFVDNAGIIDFDETQEVSFKVETHNHPSAIEPFGGANTGVGGVIRDVLGVSAKPIAATDVLCFGFQDEDITSLPPGVLHPRRIQSGVVAGVQDYGNKIGIPTVNGAILYDPGYTANPLVFCGCVGIAPKDSHPRQPRPGDHVILLGGGTGRDGLRGATFSSMTMDAQTGEVSGASVQIGDPITEKGLIEVILRARDQGLYHAITDCGAGGLSSAVGEMASQVGADVDLSRVRLKYPGLAPWEIWLSEAQERMVLAVPEASIPALHLWCDTFEVEFTDIGAFTGSDRLVVRYDGQVVLDLSNAFLHEGIPQRRLVARIVPPSLGSTGVQSSTEAQDYQGSLLKLLAHPDIATKEAVIRIYDHEVQGGTVVKPLTGVLNDGPSDACVLKPIGTSGSCGIVLSNGINPQYGKLDAYRMAFSVVDEAIRNAVAVGADPERIALLDNFCWGDPKRPETLGSLLEAARGCYEAAVYYQTPFISGKDSLNNEYLGSDGQRHAIPPTLLISAIGWIADVDQAVTMDLKEPGNILYLLGENAPDSQGVYYAQLTGQSDPELPAIPAGLPQRYQALNAIMQKGWVRACHDLSEGGLAVAAAEMCLAGRLGLDLQLGEGDPALLLFGESNGRLLVEVSPPDCANFETALQSQPLHRLGVVTREPYLRLSIAEDLVCSLPVAAILAAWQPAS